MQIKPPALILAGGMSSRMGQDKAHALLCGKALIEHVTERLSPQVSRFVINSNDPDAQHIYSPHAVTADLTDRPYGPLSGILTAMRYFTDTEHSHVLTASVDCPFLPLDLSTRLAEAATKKSKVVIAASNGTIHPTIALWPLSLADKLDEWLKSAPRYSIKAFLDSCEVACVDFPRQSLGGAEIDPFFNVNSPEDLSQAQQLLCP